MKIIKVAAAAIIQNNKVLVTKRLGGEFDGMWEVPGGKIETDETAQQTVVREIREELEVEVTVKELCISIKYEYPNFLLKMEVYYAAIVDGEIKLHDHSAYLWADKKTLSQLLWIHADIEVAQALINSSLL